MREVIQAVYTFPFWLLGWVSGLCVKGFLLARAALVKGFEDGKL